MTTEEIRAFIEKETGFNVTVENVEKNGLMKESFIIHYDKSCDGDSSPQISAVIPVEYINDDNVKYAVDSIKANHEDQVSVVGEFFETFNDFEKCKDLLRIRISRHMDGSKKINIHHADLDIDEYVVIMFDTYSVNVGRKMVEKWGKEESYIFDLARKNSEKEFVRSFRDVMKGLASDIGVEDDEIDSLKDDFMLVVTNHQNRFASRALLNNDLFKNTADNLNSDLIILPSSIDELLIVKDNGHDIDAYLDMVKQVNKTMPDNMILNEHVYKFSRDSMKVSIAA